MRAPLSLNKTILEERQGILIRMESQSGAVGWGEAAPLPGFSPERLSTVEQQLKALKATWAHQHLRGNPVDPDGEIAHQLDQHNLEASSRFGWELALWDCYAAEHMQALPAALSTRPHAMVKLNGLLLGSLEDVVAEAKQMQENGYEAIKVKVGRRPLGEDISRVKAIAEALEPDIRLRLDANRAWTVQQAKTFVESLDGIAVEYLEEPLADPTLLFAFARASKMPIALDETLVGMQVDALLSYKGIRAIIVKPTLVGGIVRARRLYRRATQEGMMTVLSAAFESGVGLRGLIALASTLGNTPIGLDTYRHLALDVINPRLNWTPPQINLEAFLGQPWPINTARLTAL